VPLLSGIDPVALEEIQAALAQGKEVTVSQNNIATAGWIGVGYIITDPITGSSAWKITSGSNGGAWKIGTWFGAILAPMLSVLSAMPKAFYNPVNITMAWGVILGSLAMWSGMFLAAIVGTRKALGSDGVGCLVGGFIQGFSYANSTLDMFGVAFSKSLTLKIISWVITMTGVKDSLPGKEYCL